RRVARTSPPPSSRPCLRTGSCTRSPFLRSPRVSCSSSPARATAALLDGRVVTYRWDFGDGTGSSEPNPTHRYANSGSYRMTLQVTDDTDLSASQTPTYQALLEPIADFDWSPVAPRQGQTVTLTSRSDSPNGAIAYYGSHRKDESQRLLAVQPPAERRAEGDSADRRRCVSQLRSIEHRAGVQYPAVGGLGT
ncbi:MAG: PKD domain-containing protein, partial [Deltaproteobacteria bacterium]|nr:PKD domain-containing protein [Deltaproteobacteria bacterium]